jgi:hypothetical protein
MKDKFHIIVEGKADKTFVEQYFCHIFGVSVPKDFIVPTGGKDNQQNATNRMRSMSANGGTNLVIFDADNDIEERRKELLEWKEKENLKFEMFLMPNDKEYGTLETLLENIINPNNKPIFKCWDKYEGELRQLKIKGRTEPLTVPGKKAKIYAYLSALLGKSDDEQKKAQIEKRDYTNPLHWNLDAEYLEPLKEFLKNNLL